MATESLVTFKQNFLRLPLNEQKRILREHGGLKQGVFSRGLHSLQKRLGYRNNNNSRKSPKFLEAQEVYFEKATIEKYNIFVSRLGNTEPDKSIKAILNFFDMYHNSIIDNPKRKIYEWLKRLLYKEGYPGIDRVIPWAINKYFAGAADAGAVLAELAAARAQGRMPILPARREMAHPPNPPPAPMDYPRAAAAEDPLAATAATPTAAAQEEEDPAASDLGPDPVALRAASRGTRAGFDDGVVGGPRADAEASAAWEAGMALRNPPPAPPLAPPPRDDPPRQALWGPSPGYFGGGSRRKSQRRKRGRKARRTRRH